MSSVADEEVSTKDVLQKAEVEVVVAAAEASKEPELEPAPWASMSTAKSSSNAEDADELEPAPWGDIATRAVVESSSESEEEATVDDQVHAFLLEEQALQRTQEIERVEKCFKLNPLDILSLPTTASVTEVKKEFRNISLLIHPDKVDDAWRERAQAAFAKVSDAQTYLLDDEKRSSLISLIVAARTKLLNEKKKAERQRRKDLIRAKKAEMASLNAPYPAYEQEPGFEAQVASELREQLIEQEMRRRTMFLAAQQEEKKMVAEAETVQSVEEQKHEQEKEWAETREARVSNWRDFSAKRIKKKKKKGVKRTLDGRPKP